MTISRHRLWLLMMVIIVLVLPTALAPPLSASAASSISLSRTNAAEGDRVSVNGSEFSSGDNVVVSADFVVNGQAQRFVTASAANGNGNFSALFVVPYKTSPRTYRITARDFHGHSASENLEVSPVAYLQVGGNAPNVSVVPRHSFYVRGNGYLGNELVRLSALFRLYTGATVTVIKTTRANKNGRFSEVQMGVPLDARPETVTLNGTGQQTGRNARAFIRVVYRPYTFLSFATVRPGTSITIHGRQFVPNSTVRLSVRLARNGAPSVVLTKDVFSNGNGDFGTSMGIPSSARTGSYILSAVDSAGGFRADTTVHLAVHPTLAVTPASAYPGQVVTVSGGGYASNVRVTVSGNFPISSGGGRNVSTSTTTGGSGGFSTGFTVPSDAAPTGSVTLTVRGPNGSAHTRLQVLTPPPTATPLPTATATPVPKHRGLRFAYVSLWYHTVRVGTSNHIVVQGIPRKRLGIWTKVYFPNGSRIAYYEDTNSRGHWETTFNVPRDAISRGSNEAVVTLRLWKGKHSTKTFVSFALVR